MKSPRFSLGLAGVGVLVLASAAAAQAPRIELELEKLVPQLEALRGVKPSSHWMGVNVRPADPLLQKHLRIDGGLVVQHVTKDGPAAEAGIVEDDILLTLNDAAIADLKGLMDFLDENKDREVAVELLREGEKKAVRLTPAKRPEGHAQLFPPDDFPFPLPPEIRSPEQWQKWLREMMKDRERLGDWKFDGEGPWKMRFFHPGVILGEDARFDADADLDLPKGLSVRVLKEGDTPARITVARGKDKWEVTEKELDELPEDVRQHVKKFLGKAPRVAVRIKRADAADEPADAKPQFRMLRIDGGGLQSRIDKNLDEINTRLEKIEQSLKKLAEKQ